jgi:hypothetical protein
MSEKLKNWIRLFWYGTFFFCATYFLNKTHGWGCIFWIAAGALFYNEASKAFDRL